LTLADENGFDVLITADANIREQQNLSGRRIAIVILRAYNNRLATHIELLGALKYVLTDIRPGTITEVLHPQKNR
jgi:hypothetical protein